MSKAKNSYYYNTFQCYKVKNVFEFFVKKNVKLSSKNKHEIFDIINVFKICEYRILKEFDCIRYNNFNCFNLRTRLNLIIFAQIREIDNILKEVNVDDVLIS